MRNHFDDLDVGKTISARALYGPVALLYAFLPIGLLFGLCRVSAGARMMAGLVPLRLLFCLVAYAAAVHLFLVWPITQWFYPSSERRLPALARVLVVFLSVAPPIYFFAYYVAIPGSHFDWIGLAAATVPPCCLAAIFYEHTRAEWVLSLFLGTGTFLPIFLFADTMGPLIPFWNYSPSSDAFYLIRNACIAGSIALAIWNTRAPAAPAESKA